MARLPWQAALKRVFPDVLLDEPLARYTSFRIGGPADAFLTVQKSGDLGRLYAFVRDHALKATPLGWGSNVLVLDGGVRGVVVRLGGPYARVRFSADGLVWAGAAVRLPKLVVACAEKGLTGAEPLVGIPGTVGGAVVMNAGTREREIGDVVTSVDLFDVEALEPRRLGAAEVRFSYRASSVDGCLVLGATLALKPGEPGDIMGRVRRFQKRRLETQPIHTFNVGSTFKNPPGRYAAQLIEEAGLKGRVHGGARISPMHANFIENFGGARATDVLALVEAARTAVRAREGLELELEMKTLGETASRQA
ncbi:MAG: UDP-N-acetylmuramate dehydrogenase [Elusimicrobia bacterium]|nr:MAG: UDP-N-acetylmuramate dehydrogenase [Elusimicrobiota bacterium]